MFDILAEAYCLTALAAPRADYEGFYLDCLGTKARGRNQEVLGLTTKRTVLDHKVIELLGMQVSRNSMFHLLPEALFQPLSLGDSATNTYEIIGEIRKNRDREQGNRLFFAPFDTEFFFYTTHMLQRQLGWPSGQTGSARQLLADMLGLDLGYADETALRLISFFASADRAKDNAPLLEELLSDLLGHPVQIHTCDLQYADFPVPSLGGAYLGVDTVLAGRPARDGQDWLVEVCLADPTELARAAASTDIQTAAAQLLSFFALATREVHVVLKALQTAESETLGQGVLGINTVTLLQAS